MLPHNTDDSVLFTGKRLSICDAISEGARATIIKETQSRGGIHLTMHNLIVINLSFNSHYCSSIGSM